MVLAVDRVEACASRRGSRVLAIYDHIAWLEDQQGEIERSEAIWERRMLGDY